MANIKSLIHDWNETGITVYTIIRRESDGHILDNLDGNFYSTATIPYIPLIENYLIKGRYELNESRSIWINGIYTAAVYKQLGVSPNPSLDIIIGSWQVDIESDDEKKLASKEDIQAIVGEGIYKITFELIDSTSLIHISDASIVVRDPNDLYNNRIIRSDSTGIAEVYLNSGIYPIRISKSMVTFPTNISIDVVGDSTFVLYGSETYHPILIIPGLQTIYGKIINASGIPEVGQIVTATIKVPKIIDDQLVSRSNVKANTDENGDFQIQIMKGSKILLSMTNYFSKEVIVTQDDFKNFTYYIN